MVNTFLTELGTNFANMARSLDKQRRFKQAVEAKEILLTIERKKQALIENNPSKKIGFKNHPIVIMWQDYTECLKAYYNAFFEQLVLDGFKMIRLQKMDVQSYFDVPWFLYYKPLIYSHQARLLQKDPIYYNEKFDFPVCYLHFGYIWIRPHLNQNYYLENEFTPELIADKLENKYQDASYCQMEFKTGSKKGVKCNRLLNDPRAVYCGIHNRKRKLDDTQQTQQIQ